MTRKAKKMKLRLIPFLLLFLLACESKELIETPVQASAKTTQNSPERQFELDIEHYLNSYNDQHWDEVYLTTYPGVFGRKTKDDVVADFIQQDLFGIKRTVQLRKIEKVSPIVENEKNRYAKIYYDALVQIDLEGEALKNKDFIQTNVELSHDTPDVVFDENKNALLLDAYCSMIAVSKKGSNIWKYIEVDKQKEPYYNQIIPEDILAQLD